MSKVLLRSLLDKCEKSVSGIVPALICLFKAISYLLGLASFQTASSCVMLSFDKGVLLYFGWTVQWRGTVSGAQFITWVPLLVISQLQKRDWVDDIYKS